MTFTTTLHDGSKKIEKIEGENVIKFASEKLKHIPHLKY